MTWIYIREDHWFVVVTIPLSFLCHYLSFTFLTIVTLVVQELLTLPEHIGQFTPVFRGIRVAQS